LVDLAEIQTAYYMVAATGVLVAAAYYVMNIREQSRSRRIAQTNNLMQSLLSVESQKIFGELLNTEWKDYDDFERKYGSDFNLDNFSKRSFLWYSFDTLGTLLKAGLADVETLYSIGTIWVTFLWIKYEPVILELRRRTLGRDELSGFEYLAKEMLRIKLERDPSYRMPETLLRYVPDK
jgi:hypothetical protein